MCEKEQKQRELIEIVQPYIEYMRTAKTWKKFRIENPHLKLPSDKSIIKYFGGWTNVKEQLGILPHSSSSWDKSTLKEDLLPYKEHLYTMSRWTNFLNDNPKIRLPRGTSLLNIYGKWDNVRALVGITKLTWTKMTKEEILKIILPHKTHMLPQARWKEYYKQNPELKLPSDTTLTVIFGNWNEVLRLVGFVEASKTPPREHRNKRKTWNVLKPEEYISIVQPHIDYLTTLRAWDKYVSDNKKYNLPSSQVLIKYFGTWNKAKEYLNLKKTIAH